MMLLANDRQQAFGFARVATLGFRVDQCGMVGFFCMSDSTMEQLPALTGGFAS